MPSRVTSQARRALLALLLAGGTVVLAVYAALTVRDVLDRASGAGALALNFTLLALELTLGALCLWLVGTLGHAPASPAIPPLQDRPRVALLVPVYGEAAAVLEETLKGIAHVRWPRSHLHVIVVDDSPDPSHAARLAEVARAEGARHVRRPARRGYKAGALNDALQGVDADVVAVLDVDHVPEPAWLERAVPLLMADPRAAYVQGRIAWRNADSRLRRMQAIFQAQFYEIIQRDKSRRGYGLFAGSACVFRRAALAEAGGFPEETLTEDFDLSVELLSRGWRGLYLPTVVARGLLPWTTWDFTRQLWRWSHGITSVVVKQTPRILRRPVPWRTKAECIGNGVAYTTGGLFVAAGLLLALAPALHVPLPRPGMPWPLLAPLLFLAADAGTALVALARSGERWFALVAPYHLMSLAFTPVLFAAAIAAYCRVGQRIEGRVAKDSASNRRPTRGLGVAAVLAGTLGVALCWAAWGLARGGWHTWIWAAEMGIAFVAPFVVGGTEALFLRATETLQAAPAPVSGEE